MANLLDITNSPHISSSYPNGNDPANSALLFVGSNVSASFGVYYGGNWNNGESAIYDGYNISASMGGSGQVDGIRVAMRELLLENNYDNTPGLTKHTDLIGPLADGPNFIISNDTITGNSKSDQVFSARGDDTIIGNKGNDLLVGGSGGDNISGGEDDDIIYGDYANVPYYANMGVTGIGIGGGKYYSQPAYSLKLPTMAETDIGVDSGETQDDLLDGGEGADTIYGGPGNDQLSGGPRGEGYTDVLTGGAGADAFLLSYEGGSSNAGKGSFWSEFGAEWSAETGGYMVKQAVKEMLKAVAEDFFKAAVGSVLLAGMSKAVGTVAAGALEMLFGMHKSPAPKPETEDVMVVTDFDPREDVLFLPLDTSDGSVSDAKTLVATAVNFGSSGGGGDAANGQVGWGIQFTMGTSNTIFAEVFLDTDFLAEFGVTSNSNVAKAFIEDVFSAALVIDENGVQQSQNVYPFSTDPNDYKYGQLPDAADTPIDFKAPNDTLNRVYGAFGPLSFLNPSVTTTGVFVSGTNMGDLLNVNTGGFAPADAVSSGKLTSETSLVKGFGGDDIIFAGNGIDVIYGGDGDDDIYGIGHEGVETVESFYGEDGNDTIYLGWTSMSAVADGGDGTDTVSFFYVNGKVTADLSQVSTDPLTDPNATSDNKADTLISNYALMNFENLGGTNNADTLTGNSDDNVIQGNGGSDNLKGGGGNDTASYVDNTGKVSVNLKRSRASEFGLDGSSEEDTVVSKDTLTNFENAIGSEYDDTLTGNGSDNVLEGGAGDNTLDGGGGSDTLSFKGASLAVAVDMSTWSSTAFTDQANPCGGTDSIRGFSNVIGGESDDSLSGNDGDNTLSGWNGEDVIAGGDGYDTVDFLDGDNGVFVHLAVGSVTPVVPTWTDAFGNADIVDRNSVEAYSGTSNDDVMIGDSDNGIDTLASADFFGEGGDDYLRGSGLAEALDGGDGDDTLIGMSGNDTLSGGDGDDILDAGSWGGESAGLPDDDTLDGGDGFDRASYINATGKVDVDLSAGSADEYGTNGTSTENAVAFTDALTDIEGVFGSAFDDTLTGDSGDNKLAGASGDDMIDGGDGTDTVDYIDRSAGIEATLSARDSNGDFTVSLSGGETDTLTSIEMVSGSDFDDTITGSTGEDVLGGGDGDDALVGLGDDDTITGGDGDDIIHGDADSPVLYRVNNGGPETQATDGGTNWAVDNNSLPSPLRSGSGGGNVATASATIYYVASTVNNSPEALFETERWDSPSGNLMKWEFPVIEAGDYQINLYLDELVKGNPPPTRIFNVSVEGVIPSVFKGINPWIQGGEDNDGKGHGAYFLSHDATISDGSISLEFIRSYGNPKINAIEIISLAPSGVVDGNDSLNGGDGEDILIGGGGDDTLNGEADSDTLDGGDGTDTASYAQNTGKVTVDLSAGTAMEYGANGGPDANTVASTDTLRNIEEVIGSQFDDELTGTEGDDTIYVGDGNDTIYGGGGNDALKGGNGNDLIQGGIGYDKISGGAGDDMLIGGAGRDLLGGNSGDDMLWGGSSNDKIYAGDGNDQVWGDNGNDEVHLGNGDDVFFDSAENNQLGRDTVFGEEGNDTIYGGGGNDVFMGGNGNDLIQGGIGYDKISGGAGDDMLMGGAGRDLLGGNSGDDMLWGGSSNDKIYAGDGNDQVWGDNGDDMLMGGAGRDLLAGGSGDDTLNGGDDNDTIFGGFGSDVFVFGEGDGADTVTDFELGVDVIGLAGGLNYENLWFAGSDIMFQDELLATLVGVDAVALSEEFDFVFV